MYQNKHKRLRILMTIFASGCCVMLVIGLAWQMTMKGTNWGLLEGGDITKPLNAPSKSKLEVSEGYASYAKDMSQLHEYKRNLVTELEKDQQLEPILDLEVSVYIDPDHKVEKVDLEQYVLGVALAELPLYFEREAIKAQMIAARTNIIYKLLHDHKWQKGNLVADISNTVEHQVYMTLEEIEAMEKNEQWKNDIEKFKLALKETEGQIVTHQGDVIEAVFFSTSNGFTENSEEYWTQSLPYLKSVASPWDKALSPYYEKEFVYSYKEMYRLLNITKNTNRTPQMKIIERTSGNRVADIYINDQRFSGREIREKLKLASSHFIWSFNDTDKQITFITYGYGHGIGMSQWGAQGMALEGKNASEIINYYYRDIAIEQASIFSSLLN